MSSDKKRTGSGKDRDQRLKQALKANLQRRKAQARARLAQSSDDDAGSDKGADPEEAGRDG